MASVGDWHLCAILNRFQYRSPSQFVGLAAEHAIECRIGEFDAPIEIDKNDAFAHGLQNHRLRPQRLLGAAP